MGRFWAEFWPQVLAVSFAVGVLGNLVASLLWAVPAFTRLHAKLDRHHRERGSQASLEQAVTDIAALRTAVDGLHDDYLRTISAVTGRLGGMPLWPGPTAGTSPRRRAAP